MLKSKIKCLKYVSLLWGICLCLVSCKTTEKSVETETLDSVLPEYVTSKEYNLQMDIRGREITAICVMNLHPDGDAVGTIINEMGVKILDFTYSHGQMKVLNLIAPLNKWLIKKILRQDFKFIFQKLQIGKNTKEGVRSIRFQPMGVVDVENRRYGINYTFTPLKE